ncbi:LON peptidase substrate-binding domain-containing protein [Vibrio sp. Of14-4]|uniref:LON peptidase substrate-binding domain-containing protein n=1 Tax=Vibrio sp. Of14-4 TaxID=2724878 RepID=UPI001EF20F4C|nr:LON peptidase substrate-binding domain-containing protein [Vibrio sp. Of14-4]
MNELMLFPLGSVLLPGGKMKLRIFEPRYKRLIKQACQADNTFGICLYDSNAESGDPALSVVGTLAEIVDFEVLDGGLLGVTIVGTKRFKIIKVRSEYDGLRQAKVEWLDTWTYSKIKLEHQHLSEYLKDVYRRFPQFSELHPECYFDDATWVCQRWLELLPVNQKEADHLLMQSDCQQAIEFLSQSIEN